MATAALSHRYMKAGVGLIELVPEGHLNYDLFHQGQIPRADALMTALDKVNRRYGRNILFLGAEGIEK